jgi:2-polyprenyl-6-methoxyphenol hydroxylase-like FAD-dependent oxidoreductase
MNSSNCPAFRVIIVGGGVAGLALAHAFHQAKIDYRILEKRQEIDKCSGAGLGMWPQGARILDQIGVLDALKTISTPMKMSYDLNPDGSENFSGPIFDAIESR